MEELAARLEAGIVLFAILYGLTAVILSVCHKPKQRPRCPVCGYLKAGPFHNDRECETMRKVRLMTEDEEAKEYWHHQHEDVLGF